MSPSEWSSGSATLGWSARGDSNPDLHGLNVPRLPIAPRADDDVGPSGWTRTTTSRVKSPACCVDTTEGIGANGGIRTRTSRLGRPAGNRYPTFALVRPTGIEPVPPRWRRGMLLHTQAERGPVSFTGPSTSVSCQRPRSFELVGGKGFEPNRSRGENGCYGPSADHPLRTAHVWRQRQDSNPDPRALEARMLPLHHAADVTHVSTVSIDSNSPSTWPVLSRRA